jgi:hypothetical protein
MTNKQIALLNAATDKVIKIMRTQECAMVGVVFVSTKSEDWEQVVTKYADIEGSWELVLGEFKSGKVPVGIIPVVDIDEDTLRTTSYPMVSPHILT